MSTEANKAVYRQFIEEVMNKKNVAAIGTFIDPNQVEHFAPPGTPGGIEGAKQLFGMFLTAFPDLHVTVEDMIAEGDKIVPRYHERNAARRVYGHSPNRQVLLDHFHRNQPHRGWQDRRALG